MKTRTLLSLVPPAVLFVLAAFACVSAMADETAAPTARNLLQDDANASGGSSGAMYYKLKISGNDNSYKFDDSPNRYLVYQKGSSGATTRRFILVGVSHKLMKELHPGESREIYVEHLGQQQLRMPDGHVEEFPVLRKVGKERVLGVGGEVMYYR